jgi:hypothetical protein
VWCSGYDTATADMVKFLESRRNVFMSGTALIQVISWESKTAEK